MSSKSESDMDLIVLVELVELVERKKMLMIILSVNSQC
jgi:hypothetical protein